MTPVTVLIGVLAVAALVLGLLIGREVVGLVADMIRRAQEGRQRPPPSGPRGPHDTGPLDREAAERQARLFEEQATVKRLIDRLEEGLEEGRPHPGNGDEDTAPPEPDQSS